MVSLIKGGVIIPWYDYFCLKCGVVEIQKSINDEDIKVCPNCNSTVKRIYGSVNDIWRTDGAYSKINHKGD